MKFNLTPFSSLALIGCLLGCVLQFLAPSALAGKSRHEVREERKHSPGARGEDGWVVTRSRKQREKTERRAHVPRTHFPFRDLNSMDENPPVILDRDNFILESEVRRRVLAQRKRSLDIQRYRAGMGLGAKHPDVMPVTAKIERLEALIWREWEADPRSRGERVK